VTDFNVETLYDDELVIAVGNRSHWAARRKINISELRDERWILTSDDRWNYKLLRPLSKWVASRCPKLA